MKARHSRNSNCGLLQNGLVEDTDQKLSKLSLKECLSLVSQNKKLQNAPANYLLSSLLKVLSYEDSPMEDEIPLDGSPDEGDLGKDPTMSQLLNDANSVDLTSRASGSGPKLDKTKKNRVFILFEET